VVGAVKAIVFQRNAIAVIVGCNEATVGDGDTVGFLLWKGGEIERTCLAYSTFCFAVCALGGSWCDLRQRDMRWIGAGWICFRASLMAMRELPDDKGSKTEWSMLWFLPWFRGSFFLDAEDWPMRNAAIRATGEHPRTRGDATHARIAFVVIRAPNCFRGQSKAVLDRATMAFDRHQRFEDGPAGPRW